MGGAAAPLATAVESPRRLDSASDPPLAEVAVAPAVTRVRSSSAAASAATGGAAAYLAKQRAQRAMSATSSDVHPAEAQAAN